MPPAPIRATAPACNRVYRAGRGKPWPALFVPVSIFRLGDDGSRRFGAREQSPAALPFDRDAKPITGTTSLASETRDYVHDRRLRRHAEEAIREGRSIGHDPPAAAFDRQMLVGADIGEAERRHRGRIVRWGAQRKVTRNDLATSCAWIVTKFGRKMRECSHLPPLPAGTDPAKSRRILSAGRSAVW